MKQHLQYNLLYIQKHNYLNWTVKPRKNVLREINFFYLKRIGYVKSSSFQKLHHQVKLPNNIQYNIIIYKACRRYLFLNFKIGRKYAGMSMQNTLRN